MNCVTCDTLNAPEARFCKNCGTAIIKPDLQEQTDAYTIKSLLILLGIDYLLSSIMFIVQKFVIPYSSEAGDYHLVDLIFKIYGWTSDVVTLAALFFFLITIKHQTVKYALVAFIILKVIFMAGNRLSPLFI